MGIQVVDPEGLTVDSNSFTVTADYPTNIPYAKLTLADYTVSAATTYNI